MGLFESIFGRKNKPDGGLHNVLRLKTETARRTELPAAVAALVAEALRIVKEQISLGPGQIAVAGTGSEGRVMLAARKFEEALKLQPENALLHYAYASALDIAAEGKSAMYEMKRLADLKPDLLARFGPSAGAQRYALFTLPQWETDRVKRCLQPRRC